MTGSAQSAVGRFVVALKLFFCPANLVRLTGLVLFFPVGLLARVIPKRDIVVLGARYGQHYDWDPKYIFEYLLAHEDERDFECFWVARTRALWEQLRGEGKPVLRLYRPADVWKVLRARIAVISTSPGDIDLHLIAGARLVHTYHGIPIRKVAGDYLEWRTRHISGLLPRLFLKVCFAIYYAVRVEAKADFIITTSEQVNDIWHSQYRHDPACYRELGCARDDGLFIKSEPALRRAPGETVISYLPTFRGIPGVPTQSVLELFRYYGFDPNAYHEFLEAHDARLVLKLHHKQEGREELVEFLKDCPRIEFCAIQDVIPVLQDTDILITDYSSVVFHYLLLDRPVVFGCFDIETYEAHMGFTLDYRTFMPGPKCLSWPEVLDAIGAYLREDAYLEHRKRARDFIFKYQDGNSCRRIAGFLNELNRTLR